MTTQTSVPCLLGPTASGKTSVALHLARATHGEVIACDAFSIYQGMQILSAAPDAPSDVPHHLVAERPPSETWSAAAFATACDALVEAIRARGHMPWIVGGTALYLRGWLKGFGAPVPRDEALRARLTALCEKRGASRLHRMLERVDPARAAELHPNDVRRVVRALEITARTGRPASKQRREWNAPDRHPATVFGLRRETADLDDRIRRRTDQLFELGVVEEARALCRTTLSPEAGQVLGLDVLVDLLEGRRTEAEAREEIARRTRRFARKQGTFFRSFEGVRWIDVAPEEPAARTAARILEAAPEIPRDDTPPDDTARDDPLWDDTPPEEPGRGAQAWGTSS